MSCKSNFFAAVAVLSVLASSAPAIGQSLDNSLIQPGTPLAIASDGSTVPSFAGLPLSNLVNQTGLSSGYTTGVTDATSAASTTHFDAAPQNGWVSNQTGGFSPFFLSFDLMAAETISAVRLWSTTITTDGLRGDLQDFEVFSDNDQDPTNGGLVSLGSFTAATQPTINDRPAEDFVFTTSNSQFFHLQVNSNQGGLETTSLGEVAFITLSAIPEPSALVLLTAMAGGLMTRRRRNTVV